MPEEQTLDDATFPSRLEELRALGSYRTVCVRICDGYHFPISTASAMSDFEADQEQCEATCPGTEVELFYQDAGDEDQGAMVSSVSGLTYEELQTAPLFQRKRPSGGPECRCKPARDLSAVGGDPAFKTEETPDQSDPGSITTPGDASRVGPDQVAAARRAQGQGRRAGVPPRPRGGDRSASTGPQESPVGACHDRSESP